MQTAFKEFSIDPAIADNPRLLREVESATRVLERVLGKSASRVRVGWEPAGQDSARLRVADPLANGVVVLPAAELGSEDRLERRLLSLWSDVLGRRVDALIEPILHPDGAGAAP
ncbi:MAG: hypothetical protein J2P46_04655 [Zavarzinella sp.]|nr:hypothetical protein [Zavarzinella sp.]